MKRPLDYASLSEVISLEICDREIHIGGALLSKPHSTGRNMDFFEYVFRNPNTLLKRADFPETIKKHLGTKPTTKILNELGFRGVILVAFFPKRSMKSGIMFRNHVTSEELVASGISTEAVVGEIIGLMMNNPK